MLVALATGWLGTWMYGRVAATACVVWVTPVCLWLLLRFLYGMLYEQGYY